jgi:hypothetical protein
MSLDLINQALLNASDFLNGALSTALTMPPQAQFADAVRIAGIMVAGLAGLFGFYRSLSS